MNLTEFAEQHQLEICVKERRPNPLLQPSNRFYVSFNDDSAARLGQCFLDWIKGNGATPEEAMADYARKISDRTLIVFPDDKKRRREIDVPALLLPC